MSNLPALVCLVDGFEADHNTDSFVDNMVTPELPNFVFANGYVVIDLQNHGSNPFFPIKFAWRVVLIFAEGQEGNAVWYVGPMIFAPMSQAVENIERIMIHEIEGNACFDVIMRGDNPDDPHVRIWLTTKSAN